MKHTVETLRWKMASAAVAKRNLPPDTCVAWPVFLGDMGAALQAIHDAGYVVVPREVTPEMQEAVNVLGGNSPMTMLYAQVLWPLMTDVGEIKNEASE